MKPARHMRRQRGRERGVFGVLYALLLIPMIGALGFTLDLAFAYTRRAELQSVADAAAMAAARALNGTMGGITAAKNSASSIAQRHNVSFGTPVVWSDAALRFSDDPDKPDGDWLPVGAVNAANVAGLYFAKVDTTGLGSSHGAVGFVFMRGNGDAGGMAMGARAVAGRTSVQVTPLAVCAIKNVALSSRPVNKPAGVVEQELLEYGFRRGVSYNLLGLSPHDTSAKSYLVNPLDYPPSPEMPNHKELWVVRPFVCAGTIAATRLAPGTELYVGETFPPTLANELNSRFNSYVSSTCNSVAAPPDRNIRPYNLPYFYWWMNAPAAIGGSAAPDLGSSDLLTIADRPGVVAGTTNESYGPLWAFSKAVHYNAGAAGGVGAPFMKADWEYLYPVANGVPVASNFSDFSLSPYTGNSGNHRTPPAIPGLPQRRVLNVPLLECPVSGSSAKVLAIGRFLMTGLASATVPAVHGEFGGLAAESDIGGTVALQR
jgi:hypothetical protein